MISVKSIDFDSMEYQEALRIRKKVFVEEQGVAPEDEEDQYESESHHFLALKDDQPVGAARWRKTDHYIKLERFAVLKEYRGENIGTELLHSVIQDLATKYPSGQKLFLHSQIDAIPLYLKFGFVEEGEIFEECGIKHRAMSRKL